MACIVTQMSSAEDDMKSSTAYTTSCPPCSQKNNSQIQKPQLRPKHGYLPLLNSAHRRRRKKSMWPWGSYNFGNVLGGHMRQMRHEDSVPPSAFRPPATVFFQNRQTVTFTAKTPTAPSPDMKT